MVKKLFEWVSSPMGRIGVVIVVLAVFSLFAYGIHWTQQPLAEQPIQFPHNLHVGLGVQCLYCHPGALRGASSGLPTQNKCWGCHQQIAKTQTSPKLAVLVDYVQNNKPIHWIPVVQVPDFVHFNHRPHIAAGVNCEDCHGDVSKMEIYENPQVLNMGWCLTCHKARTEDNIQNNPSNDPGISAMLQEKRTKLIDCGTCHY